MTPEAALVELLDRVGARHGAAIVVSDHELDEWPSAAVGAMKSQGLIKKTRPATSAVCLGCERECIMAVHILSARGREPEAFVVCDKRSDINRVNVSVNRLNQWRCDAQAIMRFVAARLGLRPSSENGADSGLLGIGMATGDKRRQMLRLRTSGGVALVAAEHSVALAELVDYRDGEYSIDVASIRQLVDSATTGDPRYTPSNARRDARKLDTQAMYEGWQQAYRNLKKQRRNMSDVWYSQQIAKTELADGRSADTIRKNMKNQAKGRFRGKREGIV